MTDRNKRATSDEPRATKATAYTAATPWLIWDKWSRGQCYKTANPPWFKQFTSLWTDPACRAVWDVPGESDGRAALIFRLTQHMAVHSAIGAVWGDPVALQRELRTEGPVDLTWLIEAGWCRYISDAEKERRERDVDGDGKAKPKPAAKQRVGARQAAPARRKTRAGNEAREKAAAEWIQANPDVTAKDLACQLSCHTRTIYRLRAWRDLRAVNKICDTTVPEERRGEERNSRVEHSIQSGTGRDGQTKNKRVRGQRQHSRAQQSTGTAIEPQQRHGQEDAQRPAEPERNPTKPEAGGAVPKSPSRRTVAPLASLPAGVTQIGRLVRLHWADLDAVAFGRDMTEALWPGRSLDTDDAKSEVGAFARWWVELKASGMAGAERREHCLAKARQVAKYGKSARRRGAVMMAILHKMFDARAGPRDA